MRFTAIALMTLTLAAAPAAAGQKETETVDKTIPFAPGARMWSSTRPGAPGAIGSTT